MFHSWKTLKDKQKKHLKLYSIEHNTLCSTALSCYKGTQYKARHLHHLGDELNVVYKSQSISYLYLVSEARKAKRTSRKLTPLL